MMKRYTFIVVTILLFTILSACGTAEAPLPTSPVEAPAKEVKTAPAEQPLKPATEAPAPQQPPPASPTIDGRELLDSRCAVCHSIERVTLKTGTAEEWGDIVSSMIARGAKLTDEEKAILVQYLAENFK